MKSNTGNARQLEESKDALELISTNEASSSSDISSAQIEYETRDHRHSKRIEPPGFALVNDNKTPCDINNLSPGGCNIDQNQLQLSEGEMVELVLILPFEAFDLKLKATGRVLRVDEQYHTVGVQFADNNPERSELIHQITSNLIRGKISEFEGLLDIRRDIDDEQSYSEASDVIEKPISRYIRYSVLITVGVLLIGVVGFSLHTMLFRVHSSFASVIAPVHRLSAPEGTTVTEVLVGIDDRVSKAAPLYKLHNPEIVDELIEFKDQQFKAQAQLQQLQSEYQDSQARLTSYQTYLDETYNNLTEEITLLEQKLSVQQAVFSRGEKGSKSGALSVNTLAEQRIDLENTKIEIMRRKQALLGIQSDRELAQKGLKSSRTNIDGRFPIEVQKEIEQQKTLLSEIDNRVNRLNSDIDKLTVRSPCDCLVSSINFNPGETLLNNTVVIELRMKDSNTLKIEALIPQQQAGLLALGNKADVLLSDRNQKVSGKVVKIDRVKSASTLKGVPQELFNVKEAAVVNIEVPITDELNAGMPAQVSVHSSTSAALLKIFGASPF